MISFDLQDEERMVQDTVRAFATSEVRPAARPCEKARAVTPGVAEKFLQLGLHAVQLPESAGGAGLGAIAGAVVAEELAWGDPGIAAALLSSYPAACILEALGDEAQRRRFLAPVAEQGARLTLALSEAEPPEAGLGVTATRDGDGFVLSGKKSFVSYGGAAALHLVAAQVDGARGWDGIGVFAVEAGTPGLLRGQAYETLGLRALPFAEVVLDGCRVPAENVLAGGGDGVRLGLHRALLKASLLSGALAVGCARAAYEYALQYAEERQAFGKPIGHFQAIAFMLSDMAMDVEAARWMVWRAASAIDPGAAEPLAAALAVTHAHEAALRVADHSVQILGGHGYMQDHPPEKWMRDAKTLGVYLCSAEFADGIALSQILGEAEVAPDESLPVSGLQPVLT
jgi:alkylation response protein AidB-like acyl-CoA dehydrogenase